MPSSPVPARRDPHPAPQRPLTTTELDQAAQLMRQWLDRRRGASSDPLIVERMRRTRTGWAAIYRIGFGEPRAVAVQARDATVRRILPEDAARLWSGVE